MIRFAPLLADVPWEALVTVVVFIIYVLNHLIGAAGKAQQRRVERPDARRQPPAGKRQELHEEVSEFLKRASEKRNAPQGQPEMARREPQRARLSKQPPLREEPLVEVQALDEPPSGEGVARHVLKHLDNREFVERAGHLTNVDQADEAIESHLHQVFDHQLGSLAKAAQAADTSPAAGGSPEAAAIPTLAESLAALMANPQTMRGAVVLSEIFNRPVHRW